MLPVLNVTFGIQQYLHRFGIHDYLVREQQTEYKTANAYEQYFKYANTELN